MIRVRDWLGLAALLVGIVLPVLGWLRTQSDLNARVADLSEAVLALKTVQDSTIRAAEIAAAVEAVLAERGRGHAPTQPEIVGKLAEMAQDGPGQSDTSAYNAAEKVTARLRDYARKRPGTRRGK